MRHVFWIVGGNSLRKPTHGQGEHANYSERTQLMLQPGLKLNPFFNCYNVIEYFTNLPFITCKLMESSEVGQLPSPRGDRVMWKSVTSYEISLLSSPSKRTDLQVKPWRSVSFRNEWLILDRGAVPVSLCWQNSNRSPTVHPKLWVLHPSNLRL